MRLGNNFRSRWIAKSRADLTIRREHTDSLRLARDYQISESFLLQKMEYIHNNPCQPHWGLSATPAEYIWSSARFYLTDEPCIIPIDDARRLLN
jgi:hypothetical protein